MLFPTEGPARATGGRDDAARATGGRDDAARLRDAEVSIPGAKVNV